MYTKHHLPHYYEIRIFNQVFSWCLVTAQSPHIRALHITRSTCGTCFLTGINTSQKFGTVCNCRIGHVRGDPAIHYFVQTTKHTLINDNIKIALLYTYKCHTIVSQSGRLAILIDDKYFSNKKLHTRSKTLCILKRKQNKSVVMSATNVITPRTVLIICKMSWNNQYHS